MTTTASLDPLSVLADIAHTQVGVHEEGDSNTGPQVRLYQAATDEPGTGWPWCAAFVCWCVGELAKLRPGLLSCEVYHCLPREASVAGLYEWAVRTRQWVVPRFDPGTGVSMLHASDLVKVPFSPQAGDIVLMQFSTGHHTGIVAGPMDGMNVPTIEGNTSGPYRAQVDERNGGEVATKVRPLGCVTHFIRLTLEAQLVNPPATHA